MWLNRDEMAVGKVFELDELRFCHDMEHDFHIRVIFFDRDQNRNHE